MNFKSIIMVITGTWKKCLSILVMTFCVNFALELLQIPRQCFTVVLTKLTMFQPNLDLFQAYNNWNSYTAPCKVTLHCQ